MSQHSDAVKKLPEIKKSEVALSREEKLEKFLDLMDDIEMVGEYAVIKFNTPIIVASEGNIALIAKDNLLIKTVDGALHLN